VRILVTGGAGFIGSHLCERLLRAGHEVLCLDNFFTGAKDNIRHLLGHDHFELIRHDIIMAIELEVDQIYNLACPASPVHYQFNPVRTIQANVLGVTNMLELAKRTRARILQASTSEVYGDPQVHPQPEAYWGHVNPIGVRACYDEGKRVAETLMMDYHRQHGVQVRIARIFNTYGPRAAVNDGRVISNFITQALRGEELTVYGDGKQTRSRSGLTFKPLPSDDPTQRRPDITLARQHLAWEPRVPLEIGLARTVEYFRDVLRRA
jgi:UDP-glucuronate decarboxylase